MHPEREVVYSPRAEDKAGGREDEQDGHRRHDFFFVPEGWIKLSACGHERDLNLKTTWLEDEEAVEEGRQQRK